MLVGGETIKTGRNGSQTQMHIELNGKSNLNGVAGGTTSRLSMLKLTEHFYLHTDKFLLLYMQLIYIVFYYLWLDHASLIQNWTQTKFIFDF